MRRTLLFAFTVVLMPVALAADPKREDLWKAVRASDLAAVKKAVEAGADVNAKNEYGVGALWIAVGKDNFEVIEYLVGKGADVNARDDIWYMTPLSTAVRGGKAKVVRFLIEKGAKDTDDAFLMTGNKAMMELILELTKVKQDVLDASLIQAIAIIKAEKDKKDEIEKKEKKESDESKISLETKEIRGLLERAGAKPIPPPTEEEKKAWADLVGSYESDAGPKMTIAVKDSGLHFNNRLVKALGPDTFAPWGSETTSFRVERKDGKVSKITRRHLTSEYAFYKFKEPVAKPSNASVAGSVKSPMNWPQFRGPDGTGVADGQAPPLSFNGKSGENVRWKTPIPGLGHSCPVVWGDRVFLTTAIGEKDPKLTVGNYGGVESVNDTSKHSWQVLCLDRDTGNILWTKTAYEGVPKIKRHLKGSQANCTIATDGKHVVACFGSEGLYCYDFAGNRLWQRDLSTLDSAFALDKEYEWGFGNSPVLHENLCILQCDLSRDSFIAAYSLDDGNRVWSTPRDEIPSWSSPVIWKNSVRTEIVTNAAQYARGYDPKTGAELWRIAKKSEVTVPTPVLGKDLAFISSGNRPIQPIIAIKPGANGDVSLKQNESTNNYVAWSTLRGGPYMPTPILYGKYLYTCSNSGVVACYDAKSGKDIYKERIGGISYTASPVASDGHLYFTSEQGEVRIVKAGPEFELISVNALDDYCLPTPAISNGSLFVRSQHYLWSLGKK